MSKPHALSVSALTPHTLSTADELKKHKLKKLDSSSDSDEIDSDDEKVTLPNVNIKPIKDEDEILNIILDANGITKEDYKNVEKVNIKTTSKQVSHKTKNKMKQKKKLIIFCCFVVFRLKPLKFFKSIVFVVSKVYLHSLVLKI
jgi:hypothetical protein